MTMSMSNWACSASRYMFWMTHHEPNRRFEALIITADEIVLLRKGVLLRYSKNSNFTVLNSNHYSPYPTRIRILESLYPALFHVDGYTRPALETKVWHTRPSRRRLLLKTESTYTFPLETTAADKAREGTALSSELLKKCGDSFLLSFTSSYMPLIESFSSLSCKDAITTSGTGEEEPR